MAAEKGQRLPSSMHSQRDVSFPQTKGGSDREPGFVPSRQHLTQKGGLLGKKLPGDRKVEYPARRGCPGGLKEVVSPWGKTSPGFQRTHEGQVWYLTLAGNYSQLISSTSRGDPDRDL